MGKPTQRERSNAKFLYWCMKYVNHADKYIGRAQPPFVPEEGSRWDQAYRALLRNLVFQRLQCRKPALLVEIGYALDIGLATHHLSSYDSTKKVRVQLYGDERYMGYDSGPSHKTAIN